MIAFTYLFEMRRGSQGNDDPPLPPRSASPALIKLRKYESTYYLIYVGYVESNTGQEIRNNKHDEDQIFQEANIDHLFEAFIKECMN